MFDYVEFVAEYATFDLHDLDHYGRTSELYNLPAIIKIDQQPRTFWRSERWARVSGRAVRRRAHRDRRRGVREDLQAGDAGGRRHLRQPARRFTYPGYGGTPQYVQHLRDLVVLLMVEKRNLSKTWKMC